MITPAYSITATERVLPKLALDFTTGVLDPRITFTRSTSGTYYAANGILQTAAIDVPRFDHNPTTGESLGLLVEESRTNLALRSEEFDNAYWLKTQSSILANSATAPDGAATADSLIENTATNVHTVSISPSVSASTAYTYTVYAKHLTGNRNAFVQCNLSGGTTGAGFAWFDLSTGVASAVSVLSGTFTGASAKMTDIGNGWYRCQLTFTTNAGNTTVALFTGAYNATRSYTGDGVSGIYIWGAQLEVGSFATSYIPTVASQVTRTADIATMTGTNFSSWYVAGAGGVVGKVLPFTVSGTRPVVQFDDTTSSEVIALRGNTTNPELYIVDAGTPQAQIDAGTIAANTVYNLGAAWNTDNCAAAVNGGAAVTDTSAILPTVTQARLGNDGTNYLNGQLQTVRYWPQRLIDAEVQAFSKG